MQIGKLYKLMCDDIALNFFLAPHSEGIRRLHKAGIFIYLGATPERQTGADGILWTYHEFLSRDGEVVGRWFSPQEHRIEDYFSRCK